MSRTLYKCEYDVGSNNPTHYTCYVVAHSIGDAAKASERPRRKNIEIAEVSNSVDVVESSDTE